MFRKLEAPEFGVVENMSALICPSCGHESHSLRSGGGSPIVVAQPDGPHAAAFARLAAAVVRSLETQHRN